MQTYFSHLIFRTCVSVLFLGSTASYSNSISKPDEAFQSGTYQELIAEDRQIASGDSTYETIASGGAAVVIGLYGYYYSATNPVIKLLYAATQTAGVITIGQALKAKYSPRLTLDLDNHFKAHPERFDREAYESMMVRHRREVERAEAMTLAYTSDILAGLYFYNGYRESARDSTLRNVYYFLGGNFAIAGVVGHYKLFKLSHGGGDNSTSLVYSPLPIPRLDYRF